MDINSLYDRILLRRETPRTMSTGGLHLPAAAQTTSSYGRVVAVGNGRRLPDGTLASLKIEVGMRVLLDQWSGSEVQGDGEKLLIVREDDILAVVDENA